MFNVLPQSDWPKCACNTTVFAFALTTKVYYYLWSDFITLRSGLVLVQVVFVELTSNSHRVLVSTFPFFSFKNNEMVFVVTFDLHFPFSCLIFKTSNNGLQYSIKPR